jgi:hypothetical protein
MKPSSDIEMSDVTFDIRFSSPSRLGEVIALEPLSLRTPLISPRSGRGPCLDPGNEPVQELVPAFDEPSFDVAGGDPSLGEREERPSIQPLKADLG